MAEEHVSSDKTIYRGQQDRVLHVHTPKEYEVAPFEEAESLKVMW